MLPFFFTLWRFIRAIWIGFKDPEFKSLFFLVIVLLVSGTLFYNGVEGWSILDSLYFSVTTLTTVGFGDLAPHTALGKIFTMIYIFVGIGIILSFITVVASHTHTSPFTNKKRQSEEL